jgi:hypothetical protein
VAVAEGGVRGEVREYGRMANTAAALGRLAHRIGSEALVLLRGRPVRQRHQTSLVGARARMRCGGTSPIPKRAGDRVT